MNSSFSTLLMDALEMLSTSLDMLQELHTVGIEFTVIRREGSEIGLEVFFQCLLTAPKEDKLKRIPLKSEKEPK
jgi:hypothetical protein